VTVDVATKVSAENLILRTDSYKFTHWKQYPPGTQRVYSYFESRGGKWPEVVFFGLQYYLKRYFEGRVITPEKIDEAEELVARHFGSPGLFNRAGWEHVLKAHEGRLPVVIRAVPEGTVVPGHNVLMTIENTDPACYWLPKSPSAPAADCCKSSTAIRSSSPSSARRW
jgi:nicotinamide phosphoribosyltransferase